MSATIIKQHGDVKPAHMPDAFRVVLARGIAATEWCDFEKLSASIFRGLGYAVELTPSTNDEGVDLLLRDVSCDTLDVAQCKHWRDPIGSPVVRDFYGAMMHFNARRGFLIATGGLTDSANQFCIGKPIVVWGMDEIIDEIFHSVISPLMVSERNTLGQRASSQLDAITTPLSERIEQISGSLSVLAKEQLFGKGLPDLRHQIEGLNDVSRRLRNATGPIIITP
jgi:hypothetical protein